MYYRKTLCAQNVDQGTLQIIYPFKTDNRPVEMHWSVFLIQVIQTVSLEEVRTDSSKYTCPSIKNASSEYSLNAS